MRHPRGIIAPIRLIVPAAMLCVLCACTSQMARSPYVKKSLDEGNFAAALGEVEKIDKGTSRLLYLYEKGLLLHYSARYAESSAALEEAERLFDDLYTKSLAREAGALFTSDAVLQYRGERFESAQIHYYKLLNYLLSSDMNGALVECRKINNKLRFFGDSNGSVYNDDPFLRYLTGMVFFDAGELSDADVSFRVALRAYTALGERYGVETPSTLRCDMARCAELLGDWTAAEKYMEGAQRCDDPPLDTSLGTLNVFLECGYVSYKIEQNIVLPIFKNEIDDKTDTDAFARGLVMRYGQPVDAGRKIDYLLRVAVPDMVRTPETFAGAAVRVQSAGRSYKTHAEIVQNVDAFAAEAFEARRGGVMLKTVTRALTKYLAKESADDRSFIAGLLVNIFNVATESADTRSWATLPRTIRMARLDLPAGTYDVDILVHGDGAGGEEAYVARAVEVRRGRATFVNFRVN